MDDSLNNQIIQEAFDRRLQERSEFRSGVENVRERISRLGEIDESPLLQEYAGRRGAEQRITLGGQRRGIPEDADVRLRRLQFAVDPTERRPEDIELRVDTEGNLRRSRQRARARVLRVRQAQQRAEQGEATQGPRREELKEEEVELPDTQETSRS